MLTAPRDAAQQHLLLLGSAALPVAGALASWQDEPHAAPKAPCSSPRGAGCFAALHSSSGFIALRCLLGIAEAGAFPGQWYFVSLFYPNHRLNGPMTVRGRRRPHSRVPACM